MAQSSKKTDKRKLAPNTTVLETLRDVAEGTTDSVKEDFVGKTSKDFVRELLGIPRPEKRISGTIEPGQTLEMEEILDRRIEENKKLKKQLILERKFKKEQERQSLKKQKELRLELHALQEETKQLAQATQGLSQEIEVATMEAPVNPGVYHVVFFEKLREFIASFRKKIENASVWLESYNERAKKMRTFWGQVSVSGAKRLLSAEDYSQRSAG